MTHRRLAAMLSVLALMVAVGAFVAPQAGAGISSVGQLLDSGTPAELYHPWGVTTDNLQNIYVADTNNHKISKFNQHGTWVVSFGHGSAEDKDEPGHLYYPEAVTWANNQIYVASTAGATVDVFTTGGSFVRRWDTEFGSGDGQFLFPRGIAADCEGNIYVADGRRGDVQKFDADGNYLDKFGSMSVPAGIAIASIYGESLCDSVGIFVTDEYAGRIVQFDGRGNFVQFIGSPGSGELQFSSPDEIAVDISRETQRTPHLWVAEAGSFRVQKLTSTDAGATWKYAGQFSSGPAAFNAPHGIAVDPLGRLIVANTGESDVYIYEDVAPKLFFFENRSLRRTVSAEGLFFDALYNQVEKTCDVTVSATVTVPLAQKHEFVARGVAKGVDSKSAKRIKADVTTKQAGWLKEALKKNKAVPVVAKATGVCSDDVRIVKTERYKLGTG